MKEADGNAKHPGLVITSSLPVSPVSAVRSSFALLGGARILSRLTALETDHRTRERRQGITLTVQARWGEPRRDQAARRFVMASRRHSSRPSRWAIRSRSITTSARTVSISRLNSRRPFRMRPAKPTPTRRIVEMMLMTGVIVTTTECSSERCRWQCQTQNVRVLSSRRHCRITIFLPLHLGRDGARVPCRLDEPSSCCRR